MVMDWSSNALTSITFKFNHMIPIPQLISLSCALKYQSHITDLLSYTIFEKELHLESNENSHKEIRVKDWYEKKYEHVWYGPNNASLIAQKMKVSIKDFFSKCDCICRKHHFLCSAYYKEGGCEQYPNIWRICNVFDLSFTSFYRCKFL